MIELFLISVARLRILLQKLQLANTLMYYKQISTFVAQVFGTEGMVAIENPRPTAMLSSTQEGTKAVPIFKSFNERYAEAYKLELDHFINALEGRQWCFS